MEVGQVEQARLGHDFPVLAELPVQPHHVEAGGVVEELGVLPVVADLAEAVCVLAADGPAGGEIVGDVHGRDVALLDELGGRLRERNLIRGRDVVEVGVLHQRVQPVVPHRAVGVAEDGLGVAPGKEVAQRARAVCVVQLAHEAGAFVQLVPQRISQQPRLAVRGGVVELLGVIRPVLDPAGKLQAFGAEGNPDPGGLAVGLRARGQILKRPDVGVRADVETVRRREVDAGGVGQAVGRVAVPVAAFHVDAGTVRESGLDAGDQIALAAAGNAQHGLGSFVVHRVVEVEAGALGVHVRRAEPAAGT